MSDKKIEIIIWKDNKRYSLGMVVKEELIDDVANYCKEYINRTLKEI